MLLKLVKPEYKLSRVYQSPEVTTAVERMTAEAQAKKAA